MLGNEAELPRRIRLVKELSRRRAFVGATGREVTVYVVVEAVTCEPWWLDNHCLEFLSCLSRCVPYHELAPKQCFSLLQLWQVIIHIAQHLLLLASQLLSIAFAHIVLT